MAMGLNIKARVYSWLFIKSYDVLQQNRQQTTRDNE